MARMPSSESDVLQGKGRKVIPDLVIVFLIAKPRSPGNGTADKTTNSLLAYNVLDTRTSNLETSKSSKCLLPTVPHPIIAIWPSRSSAVRSCTQTQDQYKMLTEAMKIVISGHLRRVRIRKDDGTKKD